MNNGNNTQSGIRGFVSNTNFYSGGTGLMAGGNTDFGAIVIVRDIGPAAATGHLFGNYNDPAGANNTQGWRILRLADTAGIADTPAVANYSVEVYGGATTLSVPFSVTATEARGRMLWIAFTYVAATDTLTVYVNGAVVNLVTAAITPIASVLGPTIGGHSVEATPALANSVFAAAYFTTISGSTPAALSSSYIETMKRCDLVPVTNLAFTFQYNVARDSGFAGNGGLGYPRTLVNYGSTAPDGDLTKQGVTAFVVSTAPVIWAGEAAGGGGGGFVGTSQYSEFYGLTAGTGNPTTTDYAATVAVKTAAGTGRVPFPRLGITGGANAPTLGGDSASAVIPEIGDYEVTFRVHTTEPGQLQLELQGADVPETCMSNMNPTAGGHEISGTFLLRTTVINSVLAVINSVGNAAALTITPANGSQTHAAAQLFTIRRIG